MIITLCGCDYTVAAVCVSMIWMILYRHTSGSVQRRDIVIICKKTFPHKYGRKVVTERKIYVMRTT
jgi:hypothetical protein